MNKVMDVFPKNDKIIPLVGVLEQLLIPTYYELGSPWRGSERMEGYIVPIILKKVQNRGYQMAEECDHKIEILDSGKIEGMNVTNPTPSFVFLRGGTVTKGSTQTRTMSYGIVLEPNMELTPVKVKCIFETRGIRQGSRSMIDNLCYVRSSLIRHLYESQKSTWDSVYRSRENMLACLPHTDPRNRLQFSRRDDYLGTLCEFRKEVLNKIHKAPLFNDQAGILVFRDQMLIGLELFDNPDSWKAVHNKVLESHVIDLLPNWAEKKRDIRDLTKHTVASQLSGYINNIKKGCMQQGKNKLLMKGDTWSTHLLSLPNEELVEYTSLHGDVIHVLSVAKTGI